MQSAINKYVYPIEYEIWRKTLCSVAKEICSNIRIHIAKEFKQKV